MNKELIDKNKKAKIGTTIVCPICHKPFKKRLYSQAFGCTHCSTISHNGQKEYYASPTPYWNPLWYEESMNLF